MQFKNGHNISNPPAAWPFEIVGWELSKHEEQPISKFLFVKTKYLQWKQEIFK